MVSVSVDVNVAAMAAPFAVERVSFWNEQSISCVSVLDREMSGWVRATAVMIAVAVCGRTEMVLRVREHDEEAEKREYERESGSVNVM